MTDLAKGLREKLATAAHVAPPAVVGDTTAEDGTRKWLLKVDGANAVEAVFIPETSRGTLCVSSQAGCALDCAFCSTGKQGFNRNLTAAEIIGQLWHANRALLADGVSAKGRPEREPRPLGGCGGRSLSAKGRPEREPGPLGGCGGSSLSAKGRPEREPRPLGGQRTVLSGERGGRHSEQGRAPVTNVVMMGMGEPLANFDNVVTALSLFI